MGSYVLGKRHISRRIIEFLALELAAESKVKDRGKVLETLCALAHLCMETRRGN